MKKYIPYLIAALIGFHLRWLVSALNGWSYSMNGADIFVALMCVVMVWSFKGAFLPKKSTESGRLLVCAAGAVGTTSA